MNAGNQISSIHFSDNFFSTVHFFEIIKYLRSDRRLGDPTEPWSRSLQEEMVCLFKIVRSDRLSAGPIGQCQTTCHN